MIEKQGERSRKIWTQCARRRTQFCSAVCSQNSVTMTAASDESSRNDQQICSHPHTFPPRLVLTLRLDREATLEQIM